MKKLTMVILASAVSISLFAQGSKEPQVAESKMSQTLVGSQCSAQPTELTIFYSMNNSPYNEDWPIFKQIEKETNVYLKGVIPRSNSNEEQAYNLMLSSGDLADIIGYKDSTAMKELGTDGGLIPLNDLIDEYAPNLKAYMEKDPNFSNYCRSLDGNYYIIAQNQDIKSAEYFWIRKDWLDILGLEVPQTVDELYTVLTAFRNEDPNGNGLKDEIPLFDRAGWKMPQEYLYLWDTSTGFYPRDGKMEFEPLTKDFKMGTANLIKWYKEGLIDPEIFTRGGKSRDILFSANNGGFTEDWVSTGNYNDQLQDAVPGFNIIPIAPLENQNGERIARTFRQGDSGWGISSTCEDPITAIRYFDFFFSPKGEVLENWGIEGEDYTVDANGQRHFTDAILNSEDSPIMVMLSRGMRARIGRWQNPEVEFATMNEIGKEATGLYLDHPEWYRDNVPSFNDGNLVMDIFPEDKAEYDRIMGDITPYVEEKFQSWILGTLDFEKDYDSFIAELHKRGIDRAQELIQRSYNAYLGK
jgi:putative aldouronate transport system substrate-binding protein